MSQIVENLTEIAGRIATRGEHPELDGWDLVAIDVEEARPVEDLPDLLGDVSGSRLEVEVPRDLLGDAGAGAAIHLRAARTGRGTVMAEPHPEEGSFSVDAGLQL